jgi:geranylgeranyl diphosphate synthase type I
MRKKRWLDWYLERFKVKFEKALKDYLETQIKELARIDEMGEVLAKVINDFTLQGGKRLRAALVELGYLATGQEETERILLPAIAVELIHSFVLIHDDIIDRSLLRRNKPTVHRVFEEKYREIFKPLTSSERQHFANSMALLTGDLCFAMGYEALSKVDFPSPLVLKAMVHLHSIMKTTVIGEIIDTLKPLNGDITEEMVLRIQFLKTARYTIEGPLHLGMILAGAEEELLAGISEYALPVGIAFQIQDDILGVFGSEEELGKPVTSDIEEGKQTLFTAFIRKYGTEEQRERFFSLLGKRGITLKEFREVKRIIRETKALDYAREKVQEFSLKGKKALENLPISPLVRIILEELADYIVKRRK